MSVMNNIKLWYSETINFIEAIKREEVFSLPVILLLFPTLAVIMAVAGFYIGIPVTRGYGVVSFVICVFLCIGGGRNIYVGMRNVAVWLGVLCFGFLWSSILFMNAATDAMCYHMPGTMLIASGWDPLFCATREALQESMGIDLNAVASYHLVHFAKITWIWGGITTLMTGNVSSSMTSSYFFMICLGIYVNRFHRLFFGESKPRRWLLVISVLSCTKITGMLTGLVDYVVYTAMILCVLTATTFLRTRRCEDLVLFSLSMIWLINAKVSGIIFCMTMLIGFVLTLLALFVMKTYEPKTVKRFARAVFMAGLFATFAGSSPYLTNWVLFGSPAYPQHTFNPAVEIQTQVLEDAFKPNEDGAQVGYIGKIVYSWFSKPTAITWYKIKTGNKGFNPKFHRAWDVNGYGTGFGLLMCLSLLVLPLARRSEVDIAIGILFLTAVVLPTSYLGYSRYAPQMWAIPFLTVTNVMANPGRLLTGISSSLGKRLLFFARHGIWCVICVVALATVIRFGLYNVYLISLASNKMESCKALQAKPYAEILLADTRKSFEGAVGPHKTVKLCSGEESFYNIESLKAAGVQNIRQIQSGVINLDEGMRPSQSLLFIDKGYILLDSSRQEYERWFGQDAVKIVNTLSDVRRFPVLKCLKNWSRYIKDIYHLRRLQLVTAWSTTT